MRIQFAFNPAPDPLVAIPPKLGFQLLGKARHLAMSLLGRVLSGIGRVHGETVLAAIVPVDSISPSNVPEFSGEIARLLQHCSLLPAESLPPDLLVTVRRFDRACKAIASAGLTAEVRVRLDPIAGSNSADDPEDGGAVLAKALLHDIRWDAYATWEAFAAAVGERDREASKPRSEQGIDKTLEKEGIAFMAWFDENGKRFLADLRKRAVRKDPAAAGLLALMRQQAPVVEFVKEFRRQRAIKAAEAFQAAEEGSAPAADPPAQEEFPPAGQG